MTLGQRIQALRKQHNLSQEALGEKLGVSRQAVSRWEMDGAVPEVDKLIAMSRLFGVSLDGLLQVEETGGSAQESEWAAGSGRKLVHLLAALCVVLALTAVGSLLGTLYFRHELLLILDPPEPPEFPIETVEYAFRPNYEDMTYDLALALTEDGTLKGWDTELVVSALLDDTAKTPWEIRQELEFRDGVGSAVLEGLPFGYHRTILVYVVYQKGELAGSHFLLELEPTGPGISWAAARFENGRDDLRAVEDPELLGPQ